MPVADIQDLSCFAHLSLPLRSVISLLLELFIIIYYNLFIQFYFLLGLNTVTGMFMLSPLSCCVTCLFSCLL